MATLAAVIINVKPQDCGVKIKKTDAYSCTFFIGLVKYLFKKSLSIKLNLRQYVTDKFTCKIIEIKINLFRISCDT